MQWRLVWLWLPICLVPPEGQPGRRPLTYDEVQALFDAVDARVDQARACGRKGALTAMRDAAVLKTVYAYGLRRNETPMLDLTDLRRTPKRPQYRQYGGLYAATARPPREARPKRRTILTIPEMDWIVDVLDHWVTEVRPLFSPGQLPAGPSKPGAHINTPGGRARIATMLCWLPCDPASPPA